MPGNAVIAAPGLVEVTPGSGVMRMQPVSVCHQVSTIGHFSPPMFLRYHIQASGLIGSPTEPNSRNEERSCPAGNSSPHFMKVRIVVGAVYRIDTLYFSTIDHHRSRAGVSGVPSYITDVVRFANGP